MAKYRYIMYMYTPTGGFDFVQVESQKRAKEELISYSEATGFHRELQANGEYGCTGSLYPYSEEGWEDAWEFRSSGCPFDYPLYLVRNGPRGGVKVIPA